MRRAREALGALVLLLLVGSEASASSKAAGSGGGSAHHHTGGKLFSHRSSSEVGIGGKGGSSDSGVGSETLDRVAEVAAEGETYLQGFFATYADVPIYNTLPPNCSDAKLTALAAAWATSSTAAGTPCLTLMASAESDRRTRRHWVNEILPICNCVGALDPQSFQCYTELAGLAGPASVLSLAQLHGWCAAEPYAYTAQTGGYGFVMDDDPNIATISIVGSGANVEVEVNLPTIPDGTQLSARGYTGSCFGASTEYVSGDGSRVAVGLACSGGVCTAAVMLDFVPSPAELGSIVIHDDAVLGVDTAPKFICATLTHPDLDVELRLPDTEVGNGWLDGAVGGKGMGKNKGVKGGKAAKVLGQGLTAGSPGAHAAAGTDHASRLMVIMICAVAAGFGLAVRRMRGVGHGEGLRSPSRPIDLGIPSVAALTPASRLADDELSVSLSYGRVGTEDVALLAGLASEASSRANTPVME